MVYISRCHRDLFLFLWGFTLVTKSCFRDFFQKALDAFILCYGKSLVNEPPESKLSFSSHLDSGFRCEILRGAITWHCGEKGSRKLGVGEGVAWIISLGSFLKSILPPTPHSWSDHIKDIGGVRASDPLCGGEVGGLWVWHMFQLHFETSGQTTGPVCPWGSILDAKALKAANQQGSPGMSYTHKR